MRSLPFVPLVLLLSVSGLSTTPAPAQQARFRDPVFAVSVAHDLVFGAAWNRWRNVTETLRLDLYEPTADPLPARPGIVYVHGGGFYTGSKRDSAVVTIAQELARRGYVFVSIDYRLQPQTAPWTDQTVTDAKEDAKAAVRWLRKEAATHRIDPARIAIMGGSAGAITALEAAYVAGEGQSGNPGWPSAVAAVVDLWGMLWKLPTLEAGEPPVCIVHGTQDIVIPFQHALDLQARAQQVGVRHELHALNFGHAAYSQWPKFLPEVCAFLYEHLQLARITALSAQPGWSSPGWLQLEICGAAQDAWILLLSHRSVAFDLGWLGILRVDPSTALAFPLQQLPPAPRLAVGIQALPVPPGLDGFTFHVQALQGRSRIPLWLTNAMSIRF